MLGHCTFLNTTTIFGTPTNVTLSELALEILFPADKATIAIVKTMVDEESSHHESDLALQNAGGLRQHKGIQTTRAGLDVDDRAERVAAPAGACALTRRRRLAHSGESRGFGNKAGHARLYNCVEPDGCRDALPNLPHDVFRQG